MMMGTYPWQIIAQSLACQSDKLLYLQGPQRRNEKPKKVTVVKLR